MSVIIIIVILWYYSSIQTHLCTARVLVSLTSFLVFFLAVCLSACLSVPLIISFYFSFHFPFSMIFAPLSQLDDDISDLFHPNLQASLKLFEIAYKKMAADRDSSGTSDEPKPDDEKKADSN